MKSLKDRWHEWKEKEEKYSSLINKIQYWEIKEEAEDQKNVEMAVYNIIKRKEKERRGDEGKKERKKKEIEQITLEHYCDF